MLDRAPQRLASASKRLAWASKRLARASQRMARASQRQVLPISKFASSSTLAMMAEKINNSGTRTGPHERLVPIKGLGKGVLN